MRRLLLLLMLITLFSLPVLAQNDNGCISDSNDIELDLATEWYADNNWPDYLASQILAYLNASGQTENVAMTVEGSSLDEITLEYYHTDVTGDAIEELILLTLFDYGSYSYNYHMVVFMCDDEMYHVLDEVAGGIYGSGAWLEVVTDTNGNHIPEIILRISHVTQKYFETLDFYEWDGQDFQRIVELRRQYGGYGNLSFTNFDDDPTTVELLVNRIYSYGETTATAFIELIEHRPVNTVYRWTDDNLELFCEYFTDSPTILYEVLQSAEAHRQCRQYQHAYDIYQRIIADYQAQEFDGTSGAFALTQEANETVDSTEFERDYLTAFAYYRVIQVLLHRDDVRNAEGYLERMQEQFPEGERGYRYTAMAEALVHENNETGDLNSACDAAYEIFDAVRDTEADPPIPYYINGEGHDIWTMPFYHYSGFAYNADPDNLFNVPEDIGNIIFIPVCLQA